MKSLKPLLLVLAGVLITVALFSFKNQESSGEYCKIVFRKEMRDGIDIVFKDRIERVPIEKGVNLEQTFMKKINEMKSEGWKITTSNSYAVSGTLNYAYENIYLEK